MSITAIGYVVMPLSLLIFLLAPRYLVPWAIALSVLQAASVVNVGGGFPIGVAPYFFVCLLIFARFVPRWLSGRFGFALGDPMLACSGALMLLVIWGVASAMVMPRLFVGIAVNTPRGGMDLMGTQPLVWTMSNLAQAGYLVLNGVFVICATSEARDPGHFQRCFKALKWSGVFVAAIGIWQLAAHSSGIPFPIEFFNSNPAWEQLTEQSIAGAWRVSATFTEPSVAGSFFAMWSTLMLFAVMDNRRAPAIDWLMLACGMAMLILTTSTTGYVAGAIVLALFALKQFRRLATSGKIEGKVLLALLTIVATVMIAIASIPNFDRVIANIIWNKADTTSGHDRVATAHNAIGLLSQTWGLGVGLGSNRPSGVIFYILSNLGIPGACMMVFLTSTTWRFFTAATRDDRAGTGGTHHQGDRRNRIQFDGVTACGWAFLIEMIAMSASGADMSMPLIWTAWGILLVACRTAWLASADCQSSRDAPAYRAVPAADRVIVLTPAHAIGSYGVANGHG
jgi:hypothetical protein